MQRRSGFGPMDRNECIQAALGFRMLVADVDRTSVKTLSLHGTTMDSGGYWRGEENALKHQMQLPVQLPTGNEEERTSRRGCGWRCIAGRAGALLSWRPVRAQKGCELGRWVGRLGAWLGAGRLATGASGLNSPTALDCFVCHVAKP